MAGKALPQYRADLRLDLKDSGAIWSDAELNRCVQRAVDDLSRYLPLEVIYEHVLSFTITDETVTLPAAASATAIVNAQTLNGVTDGGTLTIADKTPDVPRRLTVKLTDADASVTALTLIVKGYDSDGKYVEESWYLKDLPTGVAVQGNQYFKYVSEVEVDDVAGTAAAGDVVSVGTGNAYDSFIELAYKPIRPETETVTSSPAGTTYTRNTDYEMDYANGRIRYINGGSMAAGTAYLVDYTKSRLGIDIGSIIPVLTRIQRVEYPIDFVPQQFVSYSLWGDFMYIGSKRTNQSQEELNTTTEHVAIYYERRHTAPGEVGPGSYPEMMDEVVEIGAAGYALLVEALQYEVQAETDLTSLGSALTNAIKYLNNNSAADVAGILQDITDDAAALRTAINTAVDAANAYLDSVAADLTTATATLVTGAAKINTINIGKDVPENYSVQARESAGIAASRASAALGYVQEAQTRLTNLQTYIQQSSQYNALATGFLEESRLRAEAVSGDLVLADRFKADGLERLNEFYTILKSKQEWRRKVSAVPVNQPA
jgi:hypothetical protein